MNNRTMPSCTIIPVMGCKDIVETIQWLTEKFQFTERWRAGDHRAQVSFEAGTIALSKQKNHDLLNLMVRVLNVDAHYEHAAKQGAVILQAPADFPYGERQYSTEDFNGHLWTFSQSIQDVVPEDWGGVSGRLD